MFCRNGSTYIVLKLYPPHKQKDRIHLMFSLDTEKASDKNPPSVHYKSPGETRNTIELLQHSKKKNVARLQPQ